jgi:tetratricopeptide (TPR) repeat protein
MLNEEQKDLLLSILDKSLNVLRRQPPTLSINALSILDSSSNVHENPFLCGEPPSLSKHMELQFKESGVYDTFRFLQKLFFHPFPQNRSTGNPYVDQENGMAVYKDEFGKITKEPVGLLGLTLLNAPGCNNNYQMNGVTRNDVVDVVKQVIHDALTAEKKRLLNLTELAKSIGEPRDRAIESMENYKRQVISQQQELTVRPVQHNGCQPFNKKHRRSIVEVDQNNCGTRPITREMYHLVRSMSSIDLDLDQQSFANLSWIGTSPAMEEFNRLTISFAQIVDLLKTGDQEREAVGFFDMILLEFDEQRQEQGAPLIFDDMHRRQLLNALLCRSYLRHRIRDFTNSHRDMDLFTTFNTCSDAASLLAIHFRAMIFEAQGYFKQAFETYSKAIETKGADQRFTHALFKRAVLRCRHFQDIQGAIEDYTNAIRSLPEYAQAYFNRGHLYHYYNVTGASKDVSKSINSHALPSDVVLALMNYDMSIALDPRNIAALNSRGILHMSKFKNYENALADFQAVLHVDPQNSKAFCNRGILYHKHLSDREKALADYDMAIHLDVKNIVVYYNRAILLHIDMNQPLRALDDYNMVETLDPKHCNAFRARAYLYRDRFNDYESYNRDIAKALQIESDIPPLTSIQINDELD